MTKFTGRFAEEMERWQNHRNPKPGKQAFYGRLCSGYTKEQAILTGDKWIDIMKSRGIARKDKPYIPTYSRLEKASEGEEYTGIDITYSKEEARIFRREFISVIEKLEWDIQQTGDKECLKELNDRLELTKAELDLFNSYNKGQ